MAQTTKLYVSLPANAICWNCGAILTSDVVQVRHDLALCYRCASSYDHWQTHLPLIADSPEVTGHTKIANGIRCWCPPLDTQVDALRFAYQQSKAARGW